MRGTAGAAAFPLAGFFLLLAAALAASLAAVMDGVAAGCDEDVGAATAGAALGAVVAVAAAGFGAGGGADALISSSERSFSSHTGLGASGVMPISWLRVVKHNISTWIFQIPS